MINKLVETLRRQLGESRRSVARFTTPASALATMEVSLAFWAASVESGIAPLPALAQGLALVVSKPVPPGPTRQFRA